MLRWGQRESAILRTLRRILSLAHEAAILQAAPRIKLRKENQRTAKWDAKAEEALLKVALQPLRDVFLFCHDSGMRPDEIISLRWDDPLWDKSLIFVREGKTRKSTRHVPLSGRVRDALRLRAKKAKTELVFASRRKETKTGHITHTGIENAFQDRKRGCKVAKGTRDLFCTTQLCIRSFRSHRQSQTGDGRTRTRERNRYPKVPASIPEKHC